MGDDPSSYRSLPAASDADIGDDVPHLLGWAVGGQFAAIVASGIFALAFLFDRKSKTLKPGLGPILLSFVPLWIALLGTCFLVVRRRNRNPLGLSPIVRVADLSWLAAGFGCQIAAGIAYSLFPVDKEALSKPANDLLGADKSVRSVLILGVVVGLGAPIVEELFYRGVVWRGIWLHFGRRFASDALRNTVSIVLSALWFAAIHFEGLQFPALFFVGCVCAYSVTRTKRLAPAIATHMGFNLTTVVALGSKILSKQASL